jgi:hypothetical protein
MEKTIRVLAVLLAAQLLLAAGLTFTGPDLAAAHPHTPLLALGNKPVDHITIEGPKGARVVLAKQGSSWVLPGAGNFPADHVQVDTLLSRLEGLQRGLPVATSASALKRFKLSDENFERRVTLTHGDDTLATVYLGSAPDMHHVNARTGKDDVVYAVKFAAYEAPDKAADWEDKTILQVPQDDIASIEVAGVTLHPVPAVSAGTGKPSSPASWQIDGLGTGEVVNQAGAKGLAAQLAQLRVGAVLGTEAKPDYGLGKPALTLSVTRQGSGKIDYRLGPTGKEGYAVLKSSARPEYFRIPGYTADALVKAAGRAQLVQAAPVATGSKTPEGSQPAGSPAQGTAAVPGSS